MGTAPAPPTDAVGRAVPPRPRPLFPYPPKPILVEARNLGQQVVATMADPVGFQRDIPTALLFIKATAYQVHLPMQLAIRMISFLLTEGTLTNCDRH